MELAELNYHKAMVEHGLKLSDLPKDAKVGITTIKQLVGSYKGFITRTGKVPASLMDKITAQDKWIYYEILDVVEETNNNKDSAPVTADEADKIAEQAEKDKQAQAQADKEKADKEAQEKADKEKADQAAAEAAEKEAKAKEEEAAKQAQSSGNGNNDNNDNKQPEQMDENTALGIAIEAELEAINKAGKAELTFDEVKSIAPKAYKVIFDTYEKGQSNGVETNKYSLLEKAEGVFTITKK